VLLVKAVCSERDLTHRRLPTACTAGHVAASDSAEVVAVLDPDGDDGAGMALYATVLPGHVRLLFALSVKQVTTSAVTKYTS
jgi:hypothetical protein